LRAHSSEPAELRARLAEAEETLRAIHRGEVDAVVVAGKQGTRVFTLTDAGRPAGQRERERRVDELTRSKRPLALQPVDVCRMWHEILAAMTLEMGDRRIEVTIGDLPPCHADPTLLRQVLVNLLGNAFKYSRTRERSVVEISAVGQPDGGGPAYAIRDNGVGFDLRKAGKLFTVFQRLHDARDFEGAGAGLTTAQRIIQRHGGRIWAESAPDAGATFFFTMGPRPSKNGG